RLALRRAVNEGSLYGAAVWLGNLAIDMSSTGRIERQERLLSLLGAAAELSGDTDIIIKHCVQIVDANLKRGQLAEARRRLEPLLADLAAGELDGKIACEVVNRETDLLEKEQRLTEADIDRAAATARQYGQR